MGSNRVSKIEQNYGTKSGVSKNTANVWHQIGCQKYSKCMELNRVCQKCSKCMRPNWVSKIERKYRTKSGVSKIQQMYWIKTRKIFVFPRTNACAPSYWILEHLTGALISILICRVNKILYTQLTKLQITDFGYRF